MVCPEESVLQAEVPGAARARFKKRMCEGYVTSENKASGGAEALSTTGNSLARSHGISWSKATLEETMRSIECTNKLIADGSWKFEAGDDISHLLTPWVPAEGPKEPEAAAPDA